MPVLATRLLRQVRPHKALKLLHLFTGLCMATATAGPPDITNVVDAVRQAGFRRSTLSYEGTFRVLRHGKALQEHNQQYLEKGLRDGSISEDQIPQLSNLMLDNSERSFRMWESEGGRFRHESGDTVSAFDGELFRLFETWDTSGHVLRCGRSDALTGLNTIETFLTTRGLSYREILEADDVSYEIALSDRAFPGTSTVLHVRGVKGDEPALITDLFLDTERDFWPLEIHSYAIWSESDGSKTRYNDTKTVISEFHHIDGCFIPASLHKLRYLSVIRNGRDVELVGIEESLRVASVKVNQSIDDQMFTIEFPAGTQFLNSDDGLTYLVDANGTVKEFGGMIDAPAKTDNPRRWLLVVVNSIALAVIGFWMLIRSLKQ